MRILITRPLYFSASLCQKIEQLGDIPEIFPVIQIAPTPHQADLLNSIRDLDTSNIIIFSSRPAVRFGLEAIRNYWSSLPETVQFAAIGAGTAQELQHFGVQKVIHPTAPPFESEALLSLPEFQEVHALDIRIFRGNGGRNLLPKTLSERGAKVKIVECYQRRLPVQNIEDRLKTWQKNPVDAIIITSSEALDHLKILLGDEGFRMIIDVPMIVVGNRTLALAHALQIRHPILAEGASDDLLIQAVVKLKATLKEGG